MSQVRAIQLRRGTRAELNSYGPLLIGELGFCTDTGELFIGTPSGNTLVNPATIDWSKVTGKPGTFAPSSHSHAWGDITGKPSSFTPSSHTHPWSQVTSAPATATRWPSWSEVTDKPSTFTPSSHTHSKSDVGLGSVQNYGIATQAQAQAGTSNSVYMTPLRVKEAIASLVNSGMKYATGTFSGRTSQGDQTINVGFAPKLVLLGLSTSTTTNTKWSEVSFNEFFPLWKPVYVKESSEGRKYTWLRLTETGFSVFQNASGHIFTSGTIEWAAFG